MVENLNEILRPVLTQFLIAMASGVSIDEFLNDQQNYTDLHNNIVSLESQILILTEDNVELNAELDLLRASSQRIDVPALQEALERALSLLSGQSTDTNGQEEPVEASPLPPRVDVDVERVDVDVERVDVDVERVDVDVERVEVREEVTAATGVVEEPVWDSNNDEEFIFDDEDLDMVSNVETPDAPSIIKNPDITEDFNNLEDSYMIMFVYSRYSHLPYHYTLDGVRYKLGQNGSQIIGLRV